MNSITYYTFPPLIPHPNQGNFYVGKSAHVFDPGEAADEVMCWAFNYDCAGARVNRNTAAIGLFIEGNYNAGGAHWKEMQLRFTSKDDVQHRPWSWRINENDFKDWGLITETYTFLLRNPVTLADYLAITPWGIQFVSEPARLAGKSFGFSDDATNVILARKGTGNFLFQGFDMIGLPGGMISTRYNQFKQPSHFQDLFVNGDFRAPQSTQLKAMQAQIDSLLAKVAALEAKP